MASSTFDVTITGPSPVMVTSPKKNSPLGWKLLNKQKVSAVDICLQTSNVFSVLYKAVPLTGSVYYILHDQETHLF